MADEKGRQEEEEAVYLRTCWVPGANLSRAGLLPQPKLCTFCYLGWHSIVLARPRSKEKGSNYFGGEGGSAERGTTQSAQSRQSADLASQACGMRRRRLCYWIALDAVPMKRDRRRTDTLFTEGLTHRAPESARGHTGQPSQHLEATSGRQIGAREAEHPTKHVRRPILRRSAGQRKKGHVTMTPVPCGDPIEPHFRPFLCDRGEDRFASSDSAAAGC
jgi:hypothetical protein